LVAKSLLSSPYLDQSSFGLFGPFQPSIAALSHVESLPKELSDITNMEQDTVAVASRHSNEMYIIDIKTMTLRKTIMLSITIYGLQYVDGEFITSTEDTLTWLSATGLRLAERKTSTGGLFIRCFSKHSYICGDGKNAISHTKDEKKQFTYSSPNLNSTVWFKA
jgi:hypothetical protein